MGRRAVRRSGIPKGDLMLPSAVLRLFALNADDGIL
jgi:hypothetical protein